MNKHLKKLSVLIRCLRHFLIYGKADKIIEDPKKILIVQTAKLGDMVCTTPMFRAVKEKYPKCKVYVLGNKINKEVVAYNDDVDEYIIEEGGVFGLAEKIKDKNFDFVAITTPNFNVLASIYLAGIPLITTPKIENGYSPLETKMYKILRKFVVSIPHRMGHYAPREYLKLLEAINVYNNNTQKYLFFSEEADIKINNYFKEKSIDLEQDLIIGLSPSVGNKIKVWDTEKFAKIVDYIYKKYSAKIIITGSEVDRKEVKRLISFINKETKIINALSQFSVDELKALISRMTLYISVDSGPIYIAEAFGVATIDIVGPLDEREQPPMGPFNKIVKLEGRKPALHLMDANPKDFDSARGQIDSITVDMVKDSIDELMEVIPK